jgi:hypothetical protein
MEDYQSDSFFTIGAIQGTIAKTKEKSGRMGPTAALREIEETIGTFEHQRHVRREAGLVPGAFEEPEE